MAVWTIFRPFKPQYLPAGDVYPLSSTGRRGGRTESLRRFRIMRTETRRRVCVVSVRVILVLVARRADSKIMQILWREARVDRQIRKYSCPLEPCPTRPFFSMHVATFRRRLSGFPFSLSRSLALSCGWTSASSFSLENITFSLTTARLLSSFYSLHGFLFNCAISFLDSLSDIYSRKPLPFVIRSFVLSPSVNSALILSDGAWSKEAF